MNDGDAALNGGGGGDSNGDGNGDGNDGLRNQPSLLPSPPPPLFRAASASLMSQRHRVRRTGANGGISVGAMNLPDSHQSSIWCGSCDDASGTSDDHHEQDGTHHEHADDHHENEHHDGASDEDLGWYPPKPVVTTFEALR